MIRSILIFLLCGGTTLQARLWLYSGTLGKSAIVLEFYEEGEDKPGEISIESVRYFYTSSLLDISLEGSKYQNVYNFKHPKERFELSRNSSGALVGLWYNHDGSKKLPVFLKEINLDQIVHPFAGFELVKDIKGNEPIDYVRSSYFKFERDSSTVYEDKTLVWVHEQHTRGGMMRLGNGFPAGAAAKINPLLDEIHLGLVLSQCTCLSFEEYNNGDNFNFSVAPVYADENLFAFEVFSDWFCGGAYPDFGEQSFLFDLHTGHQYELDEILAFAEKVPEGNRIGDNEEWFTYRAEVFAPALVDLLLQFHALETEAEDDFDCGYLDKEHWHHTGWSFTEEGMTFSPYFPHAMAPCRESFLLPFDALKKYRNPGFPYPFPE